MTDDPMGRHRAGRPASWPDSLPMVDARDGVSHYLDGDVHGDALAAGRVHFRTLCGRMVLAASLMTPTGPPWCDPCRSEARRRRSANDAVTVVTRGGWARRVTGLFDQAGRWSR